MKTMSQCKLRKRQSFCKCRCAKIYLTQSTQSIPSPFYARRGRPGTLSNWTRELSWGNCIFFIRKLATLIVTAWSCCRHASKNVLKAPFICPATFSTTNLVRTAPTSSLMQKSIVAATHSRQRRHQFHTNKHFATNWYVQAGCMMRPQWTRL